MLLTNRQKGSNFQGDRKMKKDCNKPCFSNGSEFGAWMNMNCDNCVKGCRYNAKNDTYTKIRCKIQEDILTQYIGQGNNTIRQKSYEATQQNDCPYIIYLGTQRPNRYKVTLQQQTLF